MSTSPDPTVPVRDDRRLRLLFVGAAALLLAAAYLLQDTVGPRAQGAAGVLCFLCVVCATSRNLRAVNWRTVGWGMGLQLLLALFILKLQIGDWRPGYEMFSAIGGGIRKFLEFSNAG
nr:hypothetical protein [Vicinamibacterales bacterium]